MSRLAYFTTLAMITTAVAPAASAAGPVRGMSPAVLAVIQSGVNHSPSFQTLVERLEDSDVVVYVRSEHASIGSLHGSLTFVSKAGGARYLVVRLFGTPGIRQVAVLGHELQHAVEIAERPDIVDEASLLRAYAQFGRVNRSRTAGRAHVAETTGAVAMAARIWREMRTAGGRNFIKAQGSSHNGTRHNGTGCSELINKG